VNIKIMAHGVTRLTFQSPLLSYSLIVDIFYLFVCLLACVLAEPQLLTVKAVKLLLCVQQQYTAGLLALRTDGRVITIKPPDQA